MQKLQLRICICQSYSWNTIFPDSGHSVYSHATLPLLQVSSIFIFVHIDVVFKAPKYSEICLGGFLLTILQMILNLTPYLDARSWPRYYEDYMYLTLSLQVKALKIYSTNRRRRLPVLFLLVSIVRSWYWSDELDIRISPVLSQYVPPRQNELSGPRLSKVMVRQTYMYIEPIATESVSTPRC